MTDFCFFRWKILVGYEFHFSGRMADDDEGDSTGSIDGRLVGNADSIDVGDET